jgi:hypothetical protein
MSAFPPLLGGKQTCGERAEIDARDLKETFANMQEWRALKKCYSVGTVASVATVLSGNLAREGRPCASLTAILSS